MFKEHTITAYHREALRFFVGGKTALKHSFKSSKVVDWVLVVFIFNFEPHFFRWIVRSEKNIKSTHFKTSYKIW